MGKCPCNRGLLWLHERGADHKSRQLSFGFAFTIPSTTATYQRCEFGRIRHSGEQAISVFAPCKIQADSPSQRSAVKATIEFGGALQPAVTSAPVALWIMTNPYQPGEDLSTQLQSHVNLVSSGSADAVNLPLAHAYLISPSLQQNDSHFGVRPTSSKLRSIMMAWLRLESGLRRQSTWLSPLRT